MKCQFYNCLLNIPSPPKSTNTLRSLCTKWSLLLLNPLAAFTTSSISAITSYIKETWNLRCSFQLFFLACQSSVPKYIFSQFSSVKTFVSMCIVNSLQYTRRLLVIFHASAFFIAPNLFFYTARC